MQRNLNTSRLLCRALEFPSPSRLYSVISNNKVPFSFPSCTGETFSLYLNIDAAPVILECCLDDTSALLPSRVQCPHSWTLIFSVETLQTFSAMSKKVLTVSMEASLETDPLRAPEARDSSGCRSRRSRVAAESACARDCFQKHSVESTSLSIASSSDIR